MKLDEIIAYSKSEEAQIEEQMREQNAERGYRNQANGISFERKQHRSEKNLGILAVLSSGSLGLVDIVSLRKTHVLLISCKKNGYVDPKERKAYDKLKTEIEKLPYPCKLQVRYKRGRKTVKTNW